MSLGTQTQMLGPQMPFHLTGGPFFSYGFPSFCLLSKIMAKIRTGSARGIFIVPLWPAQLQFPAMFHLLAAKPIILPQSEDFLFLPSSSKKYPLLPQLRLMACLLSGTTSERIAFLMRQPKLSWQLEAIFETSVFILSQTMV